MQFDVKKVCRLVRETFGIKDASSAGIDQQNPLETDARVSADIPTILASTEKLLAINKGLADPDERDSWEFKRVFSPDQLMAERVNLDADKVMRHTMRRLAKTRNLKSIGAAHFDPYTEGMIVGHPLSSPLEEINVMHLVEQARRITGMGPGGLPSEDSITAEASNVHPSQFGFVSPIEGPECFSEDTLVFARQGWIYWPLVTMTTELACQVDGRLEYHFPERIIAEYYDGQMLGVKSQDFDFLVTPNHRVFTKTADTSVKNQGYQWDTIVDIYGKNRKFPTSHLPYIGGFTGECSGGGKGWNYWQCLPYSGNVYCATVPGGMLFTRRGRGVGFWSGNSSRAGIDVRVSHGVRFGDDGRLYQRFFDRRRGRHVWMSPSDTAHLTLALPD